MLSRKAERSESGHAGASVTGANRMPTTVLKDSDTPGDVVALYLFVGAAAIVALLATAFTDDPAFRFHGYFMMAAAVIALAAMTLGVAHGRFRSYPARA